MWPNVNVRRNVPNVEGALTPVNTLFIPLWRGTSMSWKESAPATIPAAGSGDLKVRVDTTGGLQSQRGRDEVGQAAARCASAVVGAKPAHPTSWGS